eukprot:7931835-Ditylum_brightwellii.AAC.1
MDPLKRLRMQQMILKGVLKKIIPIFKALMNATMKNVRIANEKEENNEASEEKVSLKKLQDKGDKYDKLIKSMSNPQYQGSDLGDSFIGCAASLGLSVWI